TLTYAALNAAANGVAHRLIAAGIGPEDRVGVALPRTAALVASLLGVLKAGAAYVPLDPAYPAARLAFMVADAAPVLVLTTPAIAALLPTARCVEWDVRPTPYTPPSTPRPTPAHAAYVIYTSGSTGQPKSTLLTHANAATLLAWADATFTAEELAGVVAATSVCFDLSVFELFVPLSRGGTVVLLEQVWDVTTPAAAGATLLNTVPSAMAAVLRTGGLPASVQTV